ncbi:hypothetical protein EJ05DRAFT_539432 [Pseudovirgaria hyperparasitica]|uniref:ER-bound oxygenase mpaB/mpaB'/Rubber oxygenase catalytic domain-containing protein n=1 Tax=Pseudovirgaria hyperparasitica TaxID=470096 RepID=A0A6A6W3C1_9PEZI|nr:uncharacterized protein EJ05DRAFT_539432 [Pseudovirgaria hyperparasitica]KAF2756476.1 hypothetical protein EJ05DRAFT_539432 [Pseudovirgaria hyperparasitica]
MACHFNGAQLGKRTESIGDSEKSASSKHEYGIDTPNFHPTFLTPEFNPEGMQKIVQEGILLAGGAVAILLQVASPGVGAGVNRNSNFAYRVEDRLRTTMTFVYCMAYGTPEEKKAIINMVHSVHAEVRGDGYSADDQELQMWVAATLYATGTDLHEKIFGKLDEAFLEQTYTDYSVLACSLRVPPTMWPKTRAEFWSYWNDMIGKLRVTEDAVNVKNDLLYNKHYPLWVRVNMPLLRVITAEWLPPSLREPYGFKRESRGRRLLYDAGVAVIRSTYPFLPEAVRFFPMKYYMKDMRRRLAKGGHVIGTGHKMQ